jgi:hypothetical protein
LVHHKLDREAGQALLASVESIPTVIHERVDPVEIFPVHIPQIHWRKSPIFSVRIQRFKLHDIDFRIFTEPSIPSALFFAVIIRTCSVVEICCNLKISERERCDVSLIGRVIELYDDIFRSSAREFSTVSRVGPT